MQQVRMGSITVDAVIVCVSSGSGMHGSTTSTEISRAASAIATANTSYTSQPGTRSPSHRCRRI